MAIDFSQVKTITIPEGSVKKITDSTGNILWKENLVGWHTVFEGNISKTWDKNISRVYWPICNLVVTDKPTKLRITGSINNTIVNPIIELTWIGENKETTKFPTLPLAINKETTQFNIPTSSYIIILKCKCTRWSFEDSVYGGFEFELNSKGELRAWILGGNNLDPYSITLNITKVEQYY